MYQLEKTPFGDFVKYRIWNEKNGQTFSIVPGHGSCLLNIEMDGRSLVDGFKTPAEVVANRWMKNTLLVPFPNRLRTGTYHWEDKTYRFYLNDSITQNAIHGFLMDKKMEVTQTGLTQEHATISCSIDYEGSLESYPFPFFFEVTYLIKASNAFEVELSFQNKGTTAIPVGLGWHPYFQLIESIDELKLQMPSSQMVGLDEFMIPTGKRYDYDEFDSLKPMKATILDNCFALNEDEGRASFVLQSPKHTLKYWQETGAGKFNFAQVFTHPDRTSIAIEPMTCNVNAFNNGEGLSSLEPGEWLKAKCGFELTSS